MTRIIKKLLLITLCFICLPVQALKLTGEVEVKYTIQDARKEALRGLPGKLDMSDIPKKDPDFKLHQEMLRSGVYETADRKITYYPNQFGSKEEYVVEYVKSTSAYHFNKKGKLKAISLDDKPPGVYPKRSIKYKYRSGKIKHIALHKTAESTYVFYPDGTFWAHWEGDYCFDEYGNYLGTRYTEYY